MKVPVTLLSLVFVGLVFAAPPAGVTQEAAEKKDAPAAQKETQWQGHVVRINKDQSMMEIRGGSAPSKDLRKVSYDSSTQWTSQEHHSKTVNNIDASQVKDNDRVICLGTWDKDGVLHASSCSKRLTN